MTVPARTIEKTLHQRGFLSVAGIDEVGRGALAGPVVAAAVVLPPQVALGQVRDSKVLTHASRVALDREIRRQASAVGIGWVSALELDELGLSRAVTLSGWRALLAARYPIDAVILDGKVAYLADDLTTHVAIRADASELSVAAASVIAKVARDKYMCALDMVDTAYGFARHKGYGTAAHLQALSALGAGPHHRQSYRPVQKATFDISTSREN